LLNKRYEVFDCARATLRVAVLYLNFEQISLLFLYNFSFKKVKSFYIVKPKATCHIARQASINAHASVRYPI